MDVRSPRGKYRAQEGAPIVRSAKQLGDIWKVIYRELELGARNPEGVWDWIGKKRRYHKSLGRLITNRAMYIYIKECIVAKSRKLREVIEKHCLFLELVAELKEPDDGAFREKFPNYPGTTAEHLNSECIEKQLGQSDVYDSTKVILNIYRIPGARAKGEYNPREGKVAR